MWAAKEGSTDVLAVLLALPQTRINDVDADGDTALAHAAANGRTEVRELEKRKVALGPLPYCSLVTFLWKVCNISVLDQDPDWIWIRARNPNPGRPKLPRRKGRNFIFKECERPF